MLLGLFFSICALCFGLMVFRGYSPFYKKTFPFLIISWCGHILGTYAYSFMGSDSSGLYFSPPPGIEASYFLNAANIFHLSGTASIILFVKLLRYLLTGDSFVATLYFFIFFSFLGSVLWYCLFIKMAELLKINYAKIYKIPALLLLCWPSFLLFTAGIKDAITYCFIPFFFLSLISVKYSKHNILSLFALLLSCFVLIMVRPYLLMIIVAAFGLASLSSPRLSYIAKILSGFFLGIFLLYSIKMALSLSGNFGGANLSYEKIVEIAVRQQQYQSIGTSFPMPKNPALVLLFIPYAFIMNLCFPLFFFSSNIMGLAASLENMALVYLICVFIKQRHNIPQGFKRLFLMRGIFFFFIFGICFLALINTNLGLSMREKSMYLPAFLIWISMLYANWKNKYRV